MAIGTGLAILGSAVIGGVGKAIAGGQQAKAAKNALNLAREQNAQTRADTSSWLTAGQDAIKQMSEWTKPGADLTALLHQQPAYQARFDQGVEAGDRAAAARGGVMSGGQQKALTRYGQTFASNELDKIFGRLSNISGQGLDAARINAGQAANLMQAGGAAYNAIGQGQAQQTGALTNLAGNIFGQFAGGGGLAPYTPASNPLGTAYNEVVQPATPPITNVPGLKTFAYGS